MTPYIGEIRMFGGNFPPLGWEFCEGQLIPISENETLFNLIGTTYGGNGETTFALPDLRGRLPVHVGNGPGVTYQLGETGGVEQVTLTAQQIPVHTHPLMASSGNALDPDPQGNVLGSATSLNAYVTDPGYLPDQLAASAIMAAGGSQPHDNMQPYLCINFIIATEGMFPPHT